jgi:hypothetical protein
VAPRHRSFLRDDEVLNQPGGVALAVAVVDGDELCGASSRAPMMTRMHRLLFSCFFEPDIEMYAVGPK